MESIKGVDTGNDDRGKLGFVICENQWCFGQFGKMMEIGVGEGEGG